jgi:hypothetical protein
MFAYFCACQRWPAEDTTDILSLRLSIQSGPVSGFRDIVGLYLNPRERSIEGTGRTGAPHPVEDLEPVY